MNIVEQEAQSSEVLRLKKVKAWAAFTKYSDASGWSHQIGTTCIHNPDPILPCGWYRNREDAIIAGSSYMPSSCTTMKLLSAEFETRDDGGVQ